MLEPFSFCRGDSIRFGESSFFLAWFSRRELKDEDSSLETEDCSRAG